MNVVIVAYSMALCLMLFSAWDNDDLGLYLNMGLALACAVIYSVARWLRG